jgi:hypothetical protein
MNETRPTIDPTTGAQSHLSDAQKKSLLTIATGVMVVCLALCGAAFAVDGERFGFSYLVGYMWAVTIALGALCWIVIWRLTKAGFAVANRRHMEWMTTFLPVAALLFIPIILKGHTIYHHWMGPEAAHDPILIKKQAWLNPTGFYIRAFIYIGLWSGIAYLFRRWSYKQDESGDKTLTTKAQFFAAPAILLLGLSISFAGFDWVMSTDPHWFSTIFGIYIFAGGAVTSLGTLGLITIALRTKTKTGGILTVEHQHDVGKFFFGFIVFWAYIAFSQFLLIWYANIPEETYWYRARWEHGWKPWGLALLFGHFVLPFCIMLSRHAKRINKVFVLGAVMMLVFHFVDLYFLVMPVHAHEFSFSWVDIAGWVGPGSVLFFMIARAAAKGPLYPLKDPRIPESMKVENL